MPIQPRTLRRYSISQAADMTGVKPHTLRLWEGEFSVLRPRRGRSGTRYYLERDLKIIELIKRLLHEERYTINGAKQKLKTDKGLVERLLSETEGKAPRPEPSAVLAEIKSDLQALLKMIESPKRK